MWLNLPFSLFILVLLSFLERRRKVYDCERRFPCLAGRFSFTVPLDFTGKMRNRWSYVFAFGAVARFVISLILNDAKDDSVPYPTALVLVKDALLVSMVCMPFFTCLSTPHRLLGGVLGLLYSLSWFVAQMWFLIVCKGTVPKDNSDGEYSIRIELLLNIPPILFLGFLVCRFGSITVRGILNRLRNYSKQEELKKHEYKYVQCLLRRPAGVPVEKSWFQRNVYEWDPYFRFPNRIIATIMLSFYGLYITVTGEQTPYWSFVSNVTMFWEEYLKQIWDEKSFQKHLNYVTYSWYISSACAALTCVIHISEVLVCYRKHIKSLRVGERKFLPKTYKLEPTHGVVGLLKYPGYQIAFSVWGYVILRSVMFVLSLIFVYLVISPIREDGFLDWLKLFAKTMGSVCFLLALVWLQRVLGYFFFLQDKISPTDEGKPLALDNRKVFHNFNYFFFFINVILGFMSCLLRVIKSTSMGLMLLTRINRTIMPEGFEKLDKSYCMWVGMIMVDHHHTNPVLVCFCHLLLKHTLESLQNSEYSRLNPEPLAKNRVRIRWLVMYTLLRNPKLIFLRKKHKQNKHKEAERAFTWAVSNMA
ncbi:stimulated by retinoic acid gene 6 protein-like isoform 2-T2 [Clarias gariepinus]|nr:stimulated by retinoic acid gene 6 protein-like isoform X2 [Clarias gariepinus]